MGRTVLEISVSLDGFVAGPNPSLELPLGEGAELLHARLGGSHAHPVRRPRMRDETVLKNSPFYAGVAVDDLGRATAFYAETLGLIEG